MDFRGPIMGSLKSPCTTSYKSLIETIEKIALFWHFGERQTDRQTDEQTNRWTAAMREAALAIASCGLTRTSTVADKPRNAPCH